MDRNTIIAEINKYQNQYSTYRKKITQAESDIEQLEYLNKKLNLQIEKFQDYITRQRNHINKYSYLTDSSRIASKFIDGMNFMLNNSDVYNIVNNIHISIKHIENEINKLEINIEQYKKYMAQSSNNYSFLKRQLESYDQQNFTNN